jgi:CRISPR system Cascade subunit CasB
MSSLLERLDRFKDHRGMMANLRCILVKNKKHRAWPVLHRLGVRIEDEMSAFIAGLFATHPAVSSRGDFGATCRAIERQRGDFSGDEDKLTPTERRFQHLLSAEAGEELQQRVLRMVLMAKAHSVPVNYDQLLQDMKRWHWGEVKTKWAASYWVPGAIAPNEEDV